MVLDKKAILAMATGVVVGMVSFTAFQAWAGCILTEGESVSFASSESSEDEGFLSCTVGTYEEGTSDEPFMECFNDGNFIYLELSKASAAGGQ